MTNNQDARPFVDLRKDAVEFRIKFDEDIKECLSFLDARITALICDPESFPNQGKSVHQNALAEFSKAKYDIFIAIKSLINTKEREWLDYIAEMKKFFIENVEIFLAGTKLEVKLPPSESASSHGSRKSPGHRKSNTVSVTGSIYPILNTITKNIPVLGSSFQEKDASHAVPKANVGDKTQFNRRGRFSTSSIKLTKSPYEEEVNIDETELDRSHSRSSSSTRSKKLNNSGLNTSQSNSGKRNSLKKEINLEAQIDIDVSELEDANQFSSKGQRHLGIFAEKKSLTYNMNTNNLPSKMRGRPGKLKLSKENVGVTNNSISTDENEYERTETNEKEIPVKGRRGRAAPKAETKKLTVAAQNNSSGTDENEDQTNKMPLKGKRRGRAKANDLTVTTQKNNSSTGESEHQVKEMPLKGRRGKTVLKTKAKDLTVIGQDNNISTDGDEHQRTETDKNEIPLKGRRGRATSKVETNDLTVDDANRTRKGRSATSKNTSNVFDQNVAQKPAGRGRRAVKPQIEDKTYESGPSQSPKKVSFHVDESSSDELDIQTPLARPAKSAVRRKTLLPNLEGTDIIPGNPIHSKAKRKTISGVAELESVAPSKRLKVSQKTISSQEEDSSADDNLLESDGNYSEWMALKSIDGKVPTQPAIYELKVWRAKKPAYIGSCESLRQKLTLYKLKHNSGHKHLDKFIDRNYNDIQVRYEATSSFDDAKEEVKDRIKSFVAQHKTTPAYN